MTAPAPARLTWQEKLPQSEHLRLLEYAFPGPSQRNVARRAMLDDFTTRFQPHLFITIRFNEALSIDGFLPSPPQGHQPECLRRAQESVYRWKRNKGIRTELPPCTCRPIGGDTHHRLHRYMSQRERFIFGYKYWKVDCGLYVAFLQGEGADVHWHLLWRLPDSVKDWDLARLRFKEDLDPDILERAVQLTGESKPAPRRLRDQNVGECYWGNQEFNERGRWKVVHRVWEPEAFEQRANRWVPHGSVLVEDLRQNDELYSVCAYVLKEYDVDRPDRLVLSSDFRKKGASNPSGNPSH